jgi:hypothetical protein
VSEIGLFGIGPGPLDGNKSASLTGSLRRSPHFKGIESFTSESDLNQQVFLASVTAALEANRAAPN